MLRNFYTHISNFRVWRTSKYNSHLHRINFRTFSSNTGSHKQNSAVPFTSETANITRDDRYKQVTREDVDYFREILPHNSVLYAGENGVSEEDLAPYNIDWFKLYRGRSPLVLQPSTTEEVSEILKYCNKQSLAVVPQGGLTGVGGGPLAVFDEIIISTRKMNNIRSFDALSGVLLCDAGCILHDLDEYLADRNHMMPLDLGAKGSCHIGANVSTNAGGLRLVRFGSLHGNVLGLEVVLPDGTILNNLSTLRKDNTGYDVKQLFIGSEGTLGFITGVSILTPRKPKNVNVAMLGFDSFDNVTRAFMSTKDRLSEILSAFEFWDQSAVDIVRNLKSDIKFPFEREYPFYALVETQGSCKDHDEEKITVFLENLMQSDIAKDGVIAQDIQQMNSLWSIRELIPEACAEAGPTLTYDFSIPIQKHWQMFEETKTYLENKGLFGPDKEITHLTGFGHLGDGNLHILAITRGEDKKAHEECDKFVMEWTALHNGSISAEHGIGIMKAKYLKRSKPAPMLALMKKIKESLDPKGIMNPYKIFA
ncbi:uncharacterized protein VTP21DRAFT_5888 [Calcarisporiella thermophila]|uniref:uncharacterized protein n=1 Tax=Calcarisporiella thermophila TaxID=911321 RepID=UPI003743FC78